MMDAAGVVIIAYLPVCLLTSKMGKASIFQPFPVVHLRSSQFSHVSGQVKPEIVLFIL